MSDIADQPPTSLSLSVAVHLHLFYPDLLPQFIDRLKRIPVPFALFVSVPEHVQTDDDALAQILHDNLPLSELKICRTPNRGRDIAPMLCTFANDLRRYDVMLHLHTKKSPHAASQTGWLSFLLSYLLPNRFFIAAYLKRLQEGAGMIVPPNYLYPSIAGGWGDCRNMPLAQELINRSNLNIDLLKDYPEIDFPQGSMFWARTDYLERLLTQDLGYEDFPEEPIGVDGTIAHALERLFFLWGHDSGMPLWRVYYSEADLQQAERVQGDMRKLYDEYTRFVAKNKKNLRNFRITLYVAICAFVAFIVTLFFLLCA
jgi:lipopolysaccharide biosynthesis protein